MSDLRKGFTPGPWIFSRFLKPDGDPIETVADVCWTMTTSAEYSDKAELFGVTRDDDDGAGATVICYTGNGPNAHNNAKAIAAIPELVATIDRLRGLLRECRDSRNNHLPLEHDEDWNSFQGENGLVCEPDCLRCRIDAELGDTT